MHMQSRSVDLDLPRARGALPGTRVCRTLWRCLSVSRAEGVCVWHFQRTTRADLHTRVQSKIHSLANLAAARATCRLVVGRRVRKKQELRPSLQIT